MPNESDPFIGVHPTPEVALTAFGDSIQLQPVTVEVDGVTHHMHYGAMEPEYVGAFPMRTDLVVLPERNPFAEVDFPITNLAPPADSYGGPVTLQVTGPVGDGQVLVTNSWGESDWGVPQNLQASRDSGYLYIGEPTQQGITFYTRDQVESLRIEDNGDFFVKGRLVQNDMEIYQAFRKFLGLTYEEPPTPEPEPRDGIENRYQRILKKCTED